MKSTETCSTLKGCKLCGGIPFTAPYFAPTDKFEEDPYCIIRCQKCGTCGALENNEEDAINAWNGR